MNIQMSRDDTARIFEPFVAERFAADDPRWTRIVSAMAEQMRSARRRSQLLGWLPGFKRTREVVDGEYTQHWSASSIERQLMVKERPGPVVWGSDRLLAHSQGLRRVYQLLLMRVVDELRPTRVLEVGAGNGLNLFVLAARFPEVHFFGAELTAGGVGAGRAFQDLTDLPEQVREFSPEPPRDLEAHRRVDLRQADATSLPYADGEFDLVYTSLALEQMEQVRHRALTDICRVARGHVMMIEPFRDWNAEGLRRDYILSHDYFSAWVSDLKGYRLEPAWLHTDIPCKANLGVGAVLHGRTR